VVDSRDFATGSADARNGDLAHLREQKLIKAVAPQFRDGERSVAVTLTKEGRALLERHQWTRDNEPRQVFYCDVAKPREMRHDAHSIARMKKPPSGSKTATAAYGAWSETTS
jgi:hypothetical protein